MKTFCVLLKMLSEPTNYPSVSFGSMNSVTWLTWMLSEKMKGEGPWDLRPSLERREDSVPWTDAWLFRVSGCYIPSQGEKFCCWMPENFQRVCFVETNCLFSKLSNFPRPISLIALPSALKWNSCLYILKSMSVSAISKCFYLTVCKKNFSWPHHFEIIVTVSAGFFHSFFQLWPHSHWNWSLI